MNQPNLADNDFEFFSGDLTAYQNDAEINKLAELHCQVEAIAKAKREESDFYSRLARELGSSLALIRSIQSRIKAGDFDKTLPQPLAQSDFEERHRAPF